MGIQVNLATKDREGNPLSINKRQFISFSYGGKNIEDFDLLAIFVNDRLDKQIYSSFNDIISKNDSIDGQLFWKTVFDAGRLNFNLATDGMTSENYEKFKEWFSPGKAKELVLSEFPNRAILARVAAPPQISLLPFEDKRSFMIAGEEKEISTSLYKGDISVEFIMDDPYWYSLESYIDDTAEDYKYSDEALKIIYEDKVPSLKMFSADENFFILGNEVIIKNKTKLQTTKVDLNVGASNVYLYNCGTGISKPEIAFSLLPEFNDSNYIQTPGNSFTNNIFSYLQIGKSKFEFTTSSLYTSYNHALLLASNAEIGSSILSLRQKMRDELHNYYTRAWAIGIIDELRKNADEGSSINISGGITELFFETFSSSMKFLFLDKDNSSVFFANYVIDAKTGRATIETKCRFKIIPDTADGLDYTIVSIEENAGDMIKSKYLKLEEQTVFNAEGKIITNNCLPVSSNCNLKDLEIKFRYAYL